MPMQARVIARWEDEAKFFDEATADQAVHPLDPLVLRRYSSASPRRRFREEFRFRILKDLRGKRVLDVGCGDGHNSVLLAKLGARVTGIDISPRSIESARKRAATNGVSDRVEFVCSPIEEAVIPRSAFDVIWGDCVLHHLIESLEFVMKELTAWAKPGALMLFSEPVNFNHMLRRLRLKLPIKTEATPDERPLECGEVQLLRFFLPDMQVRFYSLLCRLERFILFEQFKYERTSLARRLVFNAMAGFDYAALSLPMVRNMGSYAVVYGHTSGPPATSPFDDFSSLTESVKADVDEAVAPY